MILLWSVADVFGSAEGRQMEYEEKCGCFQSLHCSMNLVKRKLQP